MNVVFFLFTCTSIIIIYIYNVYRERLAAKEINYSLKMAILQNK